VAPKAIHRDFTHIRKTKVKPHRDILVQRRIVLLSGPAHATRKISDLTATFTGKLRFLKRRKLEKARDSGTDRATRFNLRSKLQTPITVFDAETTGSRGCLTQLRSLHTRIDMPIGGDLPQREARVQRFQQAEARLAEDVQSAFQNATNAIDEVIRQYSAFK
jgi:hypothetical protein